MGRPILTLVVPDMERNRPHIVAASTNPSLLKAFRRAVLADATRNAEQAGNGTVASVEQVRVARLREVLDLLIPEGKAGQAQQSRGADGDG